MSNLKVVISNLCIFIECAQGKCIECSPLDNTVCIECKDKYWNDEGTCKGIHNTKIYYLIT